MLTRLHGFAYPNPRARATYKYSFLPEPPMWAPPHKQSTKTFASPCGGRTRGAGSGALILKGRPVLGSWIVRFANQFQPHPGPSPHAILLPPKLFFLMPKSTPSRFPNPTRDQRAIPSFSPPPYKDKGRPRPEGNWFRMARASPTSTPFPKFETSSRS